MSGRTFRGAFRGDGEFFYVCPTWTTCMSTNGMWVAVTEQMWQMSQDWLCSCGKPMNIRIPVEQARKEWDEWTRHSPK